MNKLYIIILVILVSCTGCAQDFKLPELNKTQIETLSSLKKLDDNLYIMDYKADYYFSEFKNKGTGNLTMMDFVEKYLDTIPDYSLWACSAFMSKIENDIIVGRNFDWENIPGLILFTTPKNGYASVSMVPIDLMLKKNVKNNYDNQKLLWAPYFPLDGMNSEGVTISELAVDGENVHNNDKITMLSLHLIRLVLDYASDLENAIELLKSYNNEASYRAHFFIADSSGNSAVIEYLNNKVVVTRNKEPWQVVTNTMLYKKSEKQLKNTCNRYKLISQHLSSKSALNSTGEAFSLLEKVTAKGSFSAQFDIYSFTQWSIVYNLTKRNFDVVYREDFENAHHYELNRMY